MRRALPFLLAVLVVAAVVVGVLQASDRAPARANLPAYDLQDGLRRLEGSPPQLARLHAQAAKLLGGGDAAVRKRLAQLRGTPVVVNVWASWCGPCRHEFPFLQRSATRWGKRVAFLGVATQDARSPAAEFLAQQPVPYPSYLDPKGEPIVGGLDLPQGPVPLTLFVGRDGEPAFTKAGGYADQAELDADVARYLRP